MPKYRKMLSNWDAPYIQAIVKLVETQSKATLITWVTDYAEKTLLPIWLKSIPDDARPKAALDAARAWLSGDIKLPVAKPIILQCHEAAREMEQNPTAQAAARAIGQAASTIHSATHCMGLALYGALAAAYDTCGIDAPFSQLEQYAAIECERMREALEAISVENEPNPAKVNWQC
jgi:hypothetical protein